MPMQNCWLRQESLQFLNEEGELTHYAASCRQDSTMSRMRIIGLVSHVRAQAAALLDLFSKSPVGHGIFVRQFDDTNIMVAPGSTETQQQGRSGHRRVSQLLGMIQHFCIRRVAGYQDGELEMLEWAQVHCPSQVLPKAGLYKLYSYTSYTVIQLYSNTVIQLCYCYTVISIK